MYRIHENPDAEKLKAFYEFITSLATRSKGVPDQVKPHALQSLLEKIRENGKTCHQHRHVALDEAGEVCRRFIGHFGSGGSFLQSFHLAIRRYPDLIIHRIIREVLTKGSLSVERIDELNEILPDAAQQSSIRERIAVDAEEESQFENAEFMMDKIGDEYEGIISSVTSFGIFVELPNTVEGLGARQLPDGRLLPL